MSDSDPKGGAGAGRTADRTTESGAPGGLDKRRTTVITAGALLALLLASIDASAVSTALPTIARDLDGASLYAWPGIAFMVTAAIVVPIAGKLSDVFGRRPLLLGGVVGFVVASLLCGISTSMIELVLFRALQGVFGGMLLSLILIVLGDINEGAGRAQAQARASAVFGIGSIVGSPVGGFITDLLGWPWIFFVNVPLGAIAFVALLGVPRSSTSGPRARVDVRGTIALSVGIAALLIGLSELNDPSVGRVLPLVLIVVGVVVMGVFVLLERTAENPLVPLSIFSYNQISVLAAVGFLVNFGVIAASFYVPLLYQGVLGVSAGNSGSLQISLMVALIVSTTVSGKVFPKVPHYRFLAAGVLLLLAATLAWLSTSDTSTSRWVPVVALAICGATIGWLYPMLTSVAQNAVKSDELAIATSQISFWRTLGGPVALAVLAGVLGSTAGGSLGTPDQVADSLQGVFLTAALVVLVAAVVVVFLREVELAPPPKRTAAPKKTKDGEADAVSDVGAGEDATSGTAGTK